MILNDVINESSNSDGYNKIQKWTNKMNLHKDQFSLPVKFSSTGLLWNKCLPKPMSGLDCLNGKVLEQV